MDYAKKMVDQYINDNFILDNFQVVDFKLLPSGKILTDINGDTILVFFDIEKNKVVYEFGEKSKEIKNVRGAGRKITVDVDQIHTFQKNGKTQEWISKELGCSLSTVKRYWLKADRTK